MAVVQQLQDCASGFVVAVLVGLLITQLLINKYGGGLHAVPSPFLAGFTNLWRVFDSSFSNPTANLIRLHSTLQSHFVRIGPRVISISDPALIDTIYGVQTPFTKTEFYSVIDLCHEGQRTPSLFESRDEAYHARICKPIAGAYSVTALKDFEPAVESTIALLMSRLDQFVAMGTSFPLEVWLQRYTFDVLCVCRQVCREDRPLTRPAGAKFCSVINSVFSSPAQTSRGLWPGFGGSPNIGSS